MEIIKRLNKIYELKSVYRFTSVDDRKESVAEHSWSSLILADYFMTTMDIELDKIKVYELIMYHDLAEIET
jgi:putative hydrolases of HD superfamily